MQLYVDMDGVLADFNRHYKDCFGVEVNRIQDNVDWKKFTGHKDFFLHIKPMPDFYELWNYIVQYDPIIITGVPKTNTREAVNNKIDWVDKYVPDFPSVITCRSSMKYIYCKPGDVLIDDWEKYKSKWVKAGGVWITHTSAKNTIVELKELGL